MSLEDSEIFHEWLAALEARHLSDLRVQEVTRALRALSSAYVQRRGPAISRSLDTAGKRAAFALFYAPLHLLTTDLVVRALGAETDPRDPYSTWAVGPGLRAPPGRWRPTAGPTSRASTVTRGRSKRRGGRIASCGSRDARARETWCDCHHSRLALPSSRPTCSMSFPPPRANYSRHGSSTPSVEARGF